MKLLKKLTCLALALIACLGAFTSCSDEDEYCAYWDTRSTEGRDISFAKITVKDYGEIVVLLDATTAPITVANFKKLVSEGFYDGLTFHRIISNFMIQGGDPLGNGTGGSDEEIKGEFSENGTATTLSICAALFLWQEATAKTPRPRSSSSAMRTHLISMENTRRSATL